MVVSVEYQCDIRLRLNAVLLPVVEKFFDVKRFCFIKLVACLIVEETHCVEVFHRNEITNRIVFLLLSVEFVISRNHFIFNEMKCFCGHLGVFAQATESAQDILRDVLTLRHAVDPRPASVDGLFLLKNAHR